MNTLPSRTHFTGKQALLVGQQGGPDVLGSEPRPAFVFSPRPSKESSCGEKGCFPARTRIRAALVLMHDAFPLGHPALTLPPTHASHCIREPWVCKGKSDEIQERLIVCWRRYLPGQGGGNVVHRPRHDFRAGGGLDRPGMDCRTARGVQEANASGAVLGTLGFAGPNEVAVRAWNTENCGRKKEGRDAPLCTASLPQFAVRGFTPLRTLLSKVSTLGQRFAREICEKTGAPVGNRTPTANFARSACCPLHYRRACTYTLTRERNQPAVAEPVGYELAGSKTPFRRRYFPQVGLRHGADLEDQPLGSRFILR